jgi:crotonobetainyl-CoA:carnitine CoA-transferase CaiB-like acyl-CoA transferase
VLDLSTGIAGGYCTKLLADYGAEVVKVEAPGEGDPLRQWGPFPQDAPDGERGLLHWYLNANKRGVTLDMTTTTGRNILQRLVPQFDIVVESFPPSRARELGVTYEIVRGDRTDLIWLSLTPFGHDGPYADYRANDLLLQAASAWLYMGGLPNREPLKTGAFISHYITGSYGAVAVLAAWASLQADGKGQHIDLSSVEALQSTTEYTGLSHSSIGDIKEVRGRITQGIGTGITACRDGYVGINVLTGSQWEMFWSFIGRPELAEDPRFATPAARMQNWSEIAAIIHTWAQEHTRQEIFAAQEWRVPLTLVATVAEILAFPQHVARGYWAEREVPGVGTVRQPGAPFKMSATPWRLRRSAPALGEHNEEVFCGALGMSRAELVLLHRHGVI